MLHRLRYLAPAAFCLLLLAVVLAVVLPTGAAADPRIAPEISVAIGQHGQADVLILLGSPPDLSPAYRLGSKEARGRWVYDTLRQRALADQQEVVAELERLGAPHRRFWLVDAVWARVDATALARLQKLASIRHMQLDAPVRMSEPAPSAQAIAAAMPWGVQRVQAPWAWSQGYTGQGVVISGQDTGYQWDHPALKRSYRGYDSITDQVDHAYSWHDAIHANGSTGFNPCGYDTDAPCDDGSHGTHTMGSMTGNDLAPTDPAWPAGAANPIGVAPGARWMGCRNMDQGFGRPSTYIECFEWLTAPYPPNGEPLDDGNPAKAPDVISNSWSCPEEEGCTTVNLGVIEPALNAADAAGIVVVVSAGNEGQDCGSIASPPAIYPRAFAAGATASGDTLASFSNRGPVAYGGGLYLKPDISAPGVNVRSSVPGGYGSMSGTSMASPHVAAVIALLLSAEPKLRGDVDMIKAIVSHSADPIYDFTCGAYPGGQPNNRFGWGVVNARRAIESLSQPGFLTGTVANAAGNALPGATVVAYTLGADVEAGRTLTNGMGEFGLQLPWGRYRIEVSHPGFHTGHKTLLLVVGGQTTSALVRLASAPGANQLLLPLVLS